MLEFALRVDLSATMAARQIVNAAVFPLVNQAVHAIAGAAAISWGEAVQRARLWSKERDAYAGSIKWQMTGDFSAMVWSDYRYAQDIETGRPARDLKDMLNTSMKVRTTKKGKRYLIIPFRHNTPGSGALAKPMPAAIYAAAKNLALSRVSGQGTRLSGTGAFDMRTRQAITVARNTYTWGDKLVSDMKRFNGMYRFDTTTPGGGRKSEYLTFRVMMEGSPGWVIPPQAGLNIVKGVVERMQPLAERALAEAVSRTL